MLTDAFVYAVVERQTGERAASPLDLSDQLFLGPRVAAPESVGIAVKVQPGLDDLLTHARVVAILQGQAEAKRSSSCGRNSPSSGFMVPISTKLAGC